MIIILYVHVHHRHYINDSMIYPSVAVVRFSSNEYTVNERDRIVQIGVQLLTITERPIVVTLTLEPGSAQCK